MTIIQAAEKLSIPIQIFQTLVNERLVRVSNGQIVANDLMSATRSRSFVARLHQLRKAPAKPTRK